MYVYHEQIVTLNGKTIHNDKRTYTRTHAHVTVMDFLKFYSVMGRGEIHYGFCMYIKNVFSLQDTPCLSNGMQITSVQNMSEERLLQIF